jgi:hypothetical protein
MKPLILALSAVLFVAFAGSPAFANRTNSFSQTPESVVKDFYNWYIRSINNQVDPVKKGKATMKKYLSAKLMQEIAKDTRDYDYFLQSQEWGDDWENKFTVSKAVIKGATATTIVTFPSNYPRVKVTLKQETGVWKIDKVLNAPSK